MEQEIISKLDSIDWLGFINLTWNMIASVVIYFTIKKRFIKYNDIEEYTNILKETSTIVKSIKKSVNICLNEKFTDNLRKDLTDYFEKVKSIEISLKKDDKKWTKNTILYLEETIRKLSVNKKEQKEINEMEMKEIANITLRIFDIESHIKKIHDKNKFGN
jgi:hypothetical protein